MQMANMYKDKDSKRNSPAQMMSSERSQPAPAFNLQGGGGANSSASEVFQVAGGLASNSARLMMLAGRETDLRLQMQMINQARMALSNSIDTLIQGAAHQSPDSADARAMQARIQALQEADRRMEMQLRRIETQHNAVQSEIEAIQRLIEENIGNSFRGTA
jgi:hypothetical protein